MGNYDLNLCFSIKIDMNQSWPTYEFRKMFRQYVRWITKDNIKYGYKSISRYCLRDSDNHCELLRVAPKCVLCRKDWLKTLGKCYDMKLKLIGIE